MSLLRGLCLGVVLLSGTAAAQPREEVYFISHAFGVEDPADSDVQQRMFTGVGVEAGRQLRTRLLWSSLRSGNLRRSTVQLDPGKHDDQALIRVLQAGFQMPLVPGAAPALESRDLAAWQALLKRAPGSALTLATAEQAIGLRPLALPATLRLGQTLVERTPTGSVGALTRHMRVVALTDAEVVLDIQLDGEQLRGRGRQAVRRSDGMPLDGRFSFTRQDRADGLATTTHRLRVVNVAAAGSLAMIADVHDDVVIVDPGEDMLRRPPFSAPSSDPADYGLDPLADGALLPWMLDADALPRIETRLLFATEHSDDAPRPLLRITADVRAPREVRGGPDARGRADDAPRIILARPRSVALLDRNGQPLPQLQAQPVLSWWILGDHTDVAESDLGFPLRLPIGLPAAQLQALDTLRIQVDVETHAWDGIETVARGAQSRRNPNIHIDWTSAQRITAVQQATPPTQTQGMWTTLVPLDTDGREVPAAQLMLGQGSGMPRAEGEEAPLDWELGRLPGRQEVAAARPVAAVKLRHYRWQAQPRQWDFQDASALLARHNRVHEIAGQDEGYDADRALRALSLEATATDSLRLAIHAPPAQAARLQQLCQVYPHGPGNAPLTVSLQDPGGDTPGWMLAAARTASTGTGAAPTPWAVSVECPASIQRFSEPLAAEVCFTRTGDGRLHMRPACRHRLVPGPEAVLARDARGEQVGALPRPGADGMLRFDGPVDALEYTLMSDQQVQRQWQLPAPAPVR